MCFYIHIGPFSNLLGQNPSTSETRRTFSFRSCGLKPKSLAGNVGNPGSRASRRKNGENCKISAWYWEISWYYEISEADCGHLSTCPKSFILSCRISVNDVQQWGPKLSTLSIWSNPQHHHMRPRKEKTCRSNTVNTKPGFPRACLIFGGQDWVVTRALPQIPLIVEHPL